MKTATVECGAEGSDRKLLSMVSPGFGRGFSIGEKMNSYVVEVDYSTHDDLKEGRCVVGTRTFVVGAENDVEALLAASQWAVNSTLLDLLEQDRTRPPRKTESIREWIPTATRLVL